MKHLSETRLNVYTDKELISIYWSNYYLHWNKKILNLAEYLVALIVAKFLYFIVEWVLKVLYMFVD